MVCVINVVYYHISPNIVYGSVSHRNVSSVGEHAHLESPPVSATCKRQKRAYILGIVILDIYIQVPNLTLSDGIHTL